MKSDDVDVIIKNDTFKVMKSCCSVRQGLLHESHVKDLMSGAKPVASGL